MPKMLLRKLRALFINDILPLTAILVASDLLWKSLREKAERQQLLSLNGEGVSAVQEHDQDSVPDPALNSSLESGEQPLSPEERGQLSDIPIAIVITNALEERLMHTADRFACAVEVATLLAMMRFGGDVLLLNGDGDTPAGLQDILRQLVPRCQDELELLLTLYAIGAEPEQHPHLHVPVQVVALLCRSLPLDDIERQRTRLLADLVVNKKEQGQRALNFSLLDRVRIVVSYSLFAHPCTHPWSLPFVSLKPEWFQDLCQAVGTPLALAHFIARQTRTATGSLLDNAAPRALSLEMSALTMDDEEQELRGGEPSVALVDELPVAAHSDPGDDALALLAKYQRGELISARITRVQPYGAFVELEPERRITGLIHRSEVWSRVEDARDYFKVGDVVTASVLDSDAEQLRLRLSMRIPEYDPLLNYWPGDTARGKVIVVWSYGALVEIEPEVKGLIHRNDMVRKVSDVSRVLSVGDEVEVLVIRVDEERRRLSLAYDG